MFEITNQPIDSDGLKLAVAEPDCGGFVSFEGWVRDHHQGRDVVGLCYSAYDALAKKEGAAVIAEAEAKWPGVRVRCCHRVGRLEIGDMAVCVAVASAHRDAAFAACRYVIDEVKARVPIWKEEFYADGSDAWVGCEGCGKTRNEGDKDGGAPHAH
ncbi:molybdenum cofactor biosynthesis protein MoaE [Sulfuriroseicoccus oceanibius]|uniref:Molybdopterin synthase catalytic subunit n=1 Tax=Sulfuriroseicoccus oceanibius TaxID=2707525 RepID=A0A7T7F193_9BACT|nr:molybdenum cofactor biosynthesis protein MoaE [Sulfuriroseicoccus oceanibius]QQL44849.1 molybdenum cofactor biosynthesis protein MoaE [Sulfuriroseicoccus oceanibius]